MDAKSVVFDLDGTLIDISKDFKWLYRAVDEAAEHMGYADVKQLSGDEKKAIAGTESFQSYVEVCQELGLDRRELWKFVSRYRAREKIRKVVEGEISEREGASDTIRRLREQGFKVGVVSNAPDESVDAVVEYMEWNRWLHFFRGVTDFDDLSHRKPDPWHLQLAKAELHVGSAVYVGDSVIDARAAENAGMKSILVSQEEQDEFTSMDITEIPENID
ncbi:MAG: HAD family hydrolase [Candidatus Nanohaloarchaea archaeon]